MEMMQGVKLLDTVEVMNNRINWLTFWIVGLLVLCGSAIFVYRMATKQHDNGWYLLLLLFALLSFGLGAVCGLLTGDQYVEEVHYKVLLEENVDMQSFLDTYEIIEQEGYILTIKEK